VLWWILFGVLLGAVGVAVLAALTWRLWKQVRQLGRDVSAAAARIAAASDALAQVDTRR
jgi:hypothetical protein